MLACPMLALTTDFNGESRNTAKIKQTLEKIARTGFTHIHWCHEWSGDYLYSVYEMFQIRDWCRELGLKVKGIHATQGVGREPFNPDNPADIFSDDTKHYASINEYNRLAGVELVKNRVDLARILEAGAIVLHFTQPFQVFEVNGEYRDLLYRQAMKSFDELEYYCKTRGIVLCLENGGSTPQNYSLYQFDTLFKRYDRDFMGLCFDTGHGNMMCKANCLEYAERYRDRLFMIHIHDSHGETGDHILPFDGTFNWEGFARVLASSPYEFPVVMEPSYKSYKDECDEQDWLDKAFSAGCRFSEMVMKYREL
jgi:sugar phosphate isomerase/epimerase